MGKTSLAGQRIEGHLSIFSQPKQPLLFYVNTKSFLCVANFPQALFRPQHLNADTLDLSFGCNNAEYLECKNVLKENIALIVQIPYKYVLQILPRGSLTSAGRHQTVYLVVFSLQTKTSLFNNCSTLFKRS